MPPTRSQVPPPGPADGNPSTAAPEAASARRTVHLAAIGFARGRDREVRQVHLTRPAYQERPCPAAMPDADVLIEAPAPAPVHRGPDTEGSSCTTVPAVVVAFAVAVAVAAAVAAEDFEGGIAEAAGVRREWETGGRGRFHHLQFSRMRLWSRRCYVRFAQKPMALRVVVTVS